MRKNENFQWIPTNLGQNFDKCKWMMYLNLMEIAEWVAKHTWKLSVIGTSCYVVLYE